MKKKEDLIYLLSRDKLKIIHNYRKAINQYMITDEGTVYIRTTRTKLPTKLDKKGNLRVLLENVDGGRSSIKVSTLVKYAFSYKNKRY